MLKKSVATLLLATVLLCPTACGNQNKENNNMSEKLSFKTALSDEDFNVPENFASKLENIQYGELEQITYTSETTGSLRKANVLLPPNYSEEKSYPVLYLLHGLGGDHTEWLNANPRYVIGNLISSGEAKEMIVVMPNVRAKENDSISLSDMYTIENYKAFDNFINDLTNDLMPYIEKNYSVATGRQNTAVAGLSMGGRESLYIGFSLPDTFGYIGSFCPAFGILPYSNMGVGEDGLFKEDTFKFPTGKSSCVMITAGISDTVVGDEPLRYHEALSANNVEHIYHEYEGGHDFNVWKKSLYVFAKNIF